MSEKTYQRDTKGEDYKGHQKDSNISREVNELMKHGADDHQAWAKLKSKFGNNQDMVNAVFDAFKDKLKYLTKKARKFKDAMFAKYPTLSVPELLKKAKKFVQKKHLSDEEFQMFFRMVVSDKASHLYYSLPNTSIAKTLGYDAVYAATSELNVKPEEQNIVEEIKRMHAETRPLHAQVVLQCLAYKDCSAEALTGSYDRLKHNAFSYVHPVLAALFFPKFNLIDEQMLMSNIGYIVKCKSERSPILTKPDYELYWSLISDPNENVCNDGHTAIVDLKNRYELQTRVWDSVLQLRQGKYYSDVQAINRFLLAIDNCKNNVYDAPDLTYVKDEGTILRKLLSAFSIRPTIISMNRLFGLIPGSSFGLGASPYDVSGISQITTVPMVTLRLPVNIAGTGRAVSLEEALTQPQWFVENKMIVPKTMQLVHSRDILVFYVGRRFQTINITRLNTPYNFNTLPMTVAGWESLNDYNVNYENVMTILGDVFALRSVVFVERSATKKNLIIGNSAGIVSEANIQDGYAENTYFLYDPQSASDMFRDNGAYVKNGPITVIPHVQPLNMASNVESFEQRARTRGTIFIYQKKGNNGQQNPLFGSFN